MYFVLSSDLLSGALFLSCESSFSEFPLLLCVSVCVLSSLTLTFTSGFSLCSSELVVSFFSQHEHC